MAASVVRADNGDANIRPYGTSFTARGNVTRTVSPGRATNMRYEVTGTVLHTSDDYSHNATQTTDSSKNYAVPSAMTAGSLSTSFTWNGYNALTSTTGPNSATASFSYDSYARPASKTAPNGQVTAFTYSSSAPHWTLATTGTRWSKTTVDGFGRAIISESGYNTGSTPTTVSVTETQYTPCGCTPVGKLLKSSLPHAPGGTVYWTEHVYDALGRTTQVKQPNNRGTTTYSFVGPTVTVTDPAGKWKKYENDAAGNLVKVNEPRPGGGADYVTDYTYSELEELLTVVMARPGLAPNPSTVTQTRTWVYASGTRRLTSVTHPESGTTSFVYNADGSLQRKTDAKGQKHDHYYDSDGRLTEVRKLNSSSVEDTCQRVNYYYGSNPFDGTFSLNVTGRLAAVSRGCVGSGGGGQFIEMYSYNSAGAVVKKRLRVSRGGSSVVDKDVTYAYGTDGKLSTVLYPGASVPYTFTYDLMDRPTKMTGPGMMAPSQTFDHARNVVYGVAGQVTSMEILKYESDNGNGTFSPVHFTETKTYDELFQLTRIQSMGMDVSYTFASTTNNGRITQRTNNLNGETVVYQYDELTRLISASVSGSGGWGQSFVHDGFGNLWQQNVTKGTAPTLSIQIDQTNNRIWGGSYDANGNQTSNSAVFDIDNRLTAIAGTGGTEEYNYLADNKRVWKKEPSGAEYVYFYGAGGQKLATYQVATTPTFALNQVSVNVYFGGKLIRADGVAVASDRLGSVMGRSAAADSASVTSHDYFPYGAEIGTATAGNRDKFGTYHRDQSTGLDYADQRYYSSASARFLTADPYEQSGNEEEPLTWNRYSYVAGDPVNTHDPTGEFGISVSFLPPMPLPNGFSLTFVPIFGGPQIMVPILIPSFMFQAPPPQAPSGGSGPSPAAPGDPRPTVASKTQAPAALQSALDKLDGNCIGQLGDRNTLKNKATNVRFWDARPQQDGLISANFIVPGAANTLLKDFRFGSYAYVLNVGRHNTNNVVLKANFFTQARVDQDITLVHELLHYFFDLDDDALAKKLGIYKVGAESSARISEWLKANCDKAKLK